MASIPLPALGVRPPEQQESPLQMYGQMMGIKNAQQEQQLRAQQMQTQQLETQRQQQALNDQQASTKALQAWDGKDINELPGLILKQGGSAQAVFGLKNQIVQQREALAKASSAELDNQQKQNDMIVGHIEAIKSAPDEQKQALYDQAKQSLGPTAMRLPQQYPGDDALSNFEKQFQGGKQLFDQEMERRKTVATESEAQAKALSAQTAADEFKAKLPGGPLNHVSQERQIATDPEIQRGKVQVAAAEGAARANVEAQAARGSDAALAKVPQHLVAPAVAAAEKAGADYTQAQSVSQRLQEMMDAARKGNVVSYQLIPQEGALQVSTSQGVHRINMAEIQNYGGGSLWQQLQGHFGKALTGQSIPESVLKDMEQMQDIQQRGSQAKYENTLDQINHFYGANFQPLQTKSNGTSKTAGGAASYKMTATGPGGHKIGSNDGGNTWVDAQTGQAVK